MAAASGLHRATHIEVEAEVRYWEDARVDGIEDADGKLIPGREGDLWKVRIDLAEGKIEGWPAVAASIHYKVCDAGEYWLTGRDGQRIAKWKGHYVPTEFLCHGKSSNDDYIVMAVSVAGQIVDFRRPDIRSEEWVLLQQNERPAATS